MKSLIIASLFLAGCSAQVGESPKANIFTGVVPIIGVEFMGTVIGVGYIGKRDATADPFQTTNSPRTDPAGGAATDCEMIAELDPSWGSIIVSVITVFGSIILAYVAKVKKSQNKSASDISEINESVNQRHLRGDGRGMFDYVIEISEKMGRVEEKLDTVDGRVERLSEKLATTTGRVRVLEGSED